MLFFIFIFLHTYCAVWLCWHYFCVPPFVRTKLLLLQKKGQYSVVKKHGEVKKKRGENVLSAYDGGSGSGHRPQSGGSYLSFWQVRNYISAFFAAAN
jgi:hypothetical protein